MIEMPSVDLSKCNGCGLCVMACRCGAMRITNNRASVVETSQCEWCTYCEAVCPTSAINCGYIITLQDREV
ncbi:MAG: 4Fe-4S binding protein [Chloroflexi bacterium]|nr:4Fe-4S binding protein [Chloroflexota bacterium]